MMRHLPSWAKFLLALWGLLAGIGWLVNGGEVRLDGPPGKYQIKDHRVYPETTMVSNAGVLEVRRWIEQRTRPVVEPLTLIWQHLWYNCITSGYDTVLWLETPDFSGTSYGLYLSGHTLFLRVEPSCWHRVLVSGFDARELQELVASFTVPLPAEMPESPRPAPLPAEAPDPTGHAP